jgi:hypothetical protein
MKTSWIQGLNKEQETEMRREYKGSALLRSRLSKLLEDKIDAARTKGRLVSTYDNPNWALLQADQIGYERALYEIISLIFEK